MSADSQRLVVVGGGPAAQSAVASYRAAGGSRPVTILAAEPELPYERPPLSKEFLRGEVGREELPLEAAEWYRERDRDEDYERGRERIEERAPWS